MTRPAGSSKYGTTRKNTQRYYTPKRLIRYMYLASEQSPMYIVICVRLLLTGLEHMSSELSVGMFGNLCKGFVVYNTVKLTIFKNYSLKEK